MELYVIDCKNIESEQEFWAAYIHLVKSDGSQYFGRNLDAFWDALSAGGPGFPGDEAGCEIQFINTSKIKKLRNGAFYQALKVIEKDLKTESYGNAYIKVE
ncbi:barstar family protein [Aeromonas schubertii]|uniref:barstar family protein n=1 Tax=Aeromonas TaxID=642 RepID=UPI0009E1B050|nr:barstar family protein [Aeromonas schubertii]